jgi:chemotaxis protein methyltransferase CheR
MEKEVLEFFTNFIKKTAGIVYEEERKYLLKKKLTELAYALNYRNLEEFFLRVKTCPTPNVLNQIIDVLTTNETYFFRDRHPFDALKNQIFPELFKKREKERKLSIWSAACSTGQEPYSIAMLLLEYFSNYLQRYNVFIYATDISKISIEKAKQGLYHQVEVNRGLPASFLVKYFKQEGTYWKIDEKVKKMVRFEQLNLLETGKRVREKFDIIMCRYVLIYFADEIKKKVLQEVWNCLKPGGYLFLGATEVPRVNLPNMEKKRTGITICYHKKD